MLDSDDCYFGFSTKFSFETKFFLSIYFYVCRDVYIQCFAIDVVMVCVRVCFDVDIVVAGLFCDTDSFFDPISVIHIYFSVCLVFFFLALTQDNQRPRNVCTDGQKLCSYYETNLHK